MTSPSPLLACEKHSLLENSMDYSSSMESVAAPSLKQEDAHFGAERALARAERSKTLPGKNPAGKNPGFGAERALARAERSKTLTGNKSGLEKTLASKKTGFEKKGGRQ